MGYLVVFCEKYLRDKLVNRDKSNMSDLKHRTVELSRRSVARALPFLRRAWHALRSALVICSTPL